MMKSIILMILTMFLVFFFFFFFYCLKSYKVNEDVTNDPQWRMLTRIINISFTEKAIELRKKE